MRFLTIASLLSIFFTANGQAQFHSSGRIFRSDTAISRMYIKNGEAKFGAANYSDALADFKLAVNYNYRSGQAFRLKGDAERELELYDSAVASYSRALQINVKDALAYKGRAESRRNLEECEGAIQDYNNALIFLPSDAEMFFGRGICEFATGVYEECINDMNVYLATEETPRAFFFRGSSYASINKFHEAVSDLTRYINEDGEMSGGYYYRGVSYAILSNTIPVYADSAVADLTKFVADVTINPLAYKFLGFAYAIKGDTVLAKKFLSQALAMNPDDVDNYYYLGTVELLSKNYAKAIDSFEKVLANGPISEMSTLYLNLAIAKTAMRDTLGALDAFAKSIEIDSKNLKVREERLDLISDKLEVYGTLAINDITEIILAKEEEGRDNMSISFYYAQRALIHAAMNEEPSAISDVDKAITIAPDYFYPYLMRAIVTMNFEKYDKDKLLSDIDKGIYLDRGKWEGYFLKALALELTGSKRKERCACVKEAIAHGGHIVITKELEDQLCTGGSWKNVKESIHFVINPSPSSK